MAAPKVLDFERVFYYNVLKCALANSFLLGEKSTPSLQLPPRRHA